MKLKGFTLLELMVVIVIISVLAGLLVPAITGYVREAKINAAIADARTIKQSIEFSLMTNLAIRDIDSSGAFNKMICFDQKTKEYEVVGGFTNYSFWSYKNNKLGGSKSQQIDTLIAGALDNAFSESWKVGKTSKNPMNYATDTQNCAEYLKAYDCNFGLVVLDDTMGSVRMMQLYRKGVLVTYINNEFIVNTSPKAHFAGSKTWDNIYKDCGIDPPAGTEKMSLRIKQIGDKGKEEGWFN